MGVPFDGGEEAVVSRVPPVFAKPRQAEQDEHHATGHAACRSWCEYFTLTNNETEALDINLEFLDRLISIGDKLQVISGSSSRKSHMVQRSTAHHHGKPARFFSGARQLQDVRRVGACLHEVTLGF